jgi:hypothetical protein
MTRAMQDEISKAWHSCSEAINQTFALVAHTHDCIRSSNERIAQSLALLRSQKIYPHDPMPPSSSLSDPESRIAPGQPPVP